LAVAHSILKNRRRRAKELNLPVERWWSVQPREFERLVGLPLYDQIAGQVASLEYDINAAAASIGGARVLPVAYEAMCTDPRTTLRHAMTFLDSHGAATDIRKEPPASFEASRPRSAAGDSDLAELGRAIDAVAELIPPMPVGEGVVA
jgi:hypothetical protein